MINRSDFGFFARGGRFREALLTVLVVVPLTVAQAAPISSDLTITGSTTFDHLSSFGPTDGALNVVSGGIVTDSAFFAGSSYIGSNPLQGSLTHTGDGFGVSGVGSGTTVGDEFLVALDTGIGVKNTSLTETYEVVFRLDYTHSVEATGFDAFAASLLQVDVNGSVDFMSDLLSDTGMGGGPMSETGTEFFTLTLAPDDLIDIAMIWFMEGGLYDAGAASGSLSGVGVEPLAFLSLESATNVTVTPELPVPGTLLLVAIGLLGFASAHRLSDRRLDHFG